MANSVDLEEVAHYDPPHQDLRCLQIGLFLSLVLIELSNTWCVPFWIQLNGLTKAELQIIKAVFTKLCLTA